MIVLIPVLVLLLAGLSLLAWTLAIYALPFMAGVEAARWAYGSGSGWIGATLVGMTASAATYALPILLLGTLRPLALRIAVALIFAAPAAVAGYALVHGIARELVPAEGWRMVFCLIGGGVTGTTALMRLFADASGER